MFEIIEYSHGVLSSLKIPGEIFSNNSGWFNTPIEDRDYYIGCNFYLNDGDKIWMAIENKKLLGFLIYRDTKWDTEYFGFSCGKIEEFKVFENDNKSRKSTIKLLFSKFNVFREKKKLRFCVASIDVWDIDISKVFEDSGFNFIVNWGSCFLDRKTNVNLPDGYNISDAAFNDIEYLQGLIKYYFKGGRFYLDANFDKVKIDKLYKKLVKNSVMDSKTKVKILKTTKNEIVGFFIYKRDKGAKICIGGLRFLLFDPVYSIQGLAQSFLSRISNDLLKDCNIVTSGIELHNTPSMAIHLKSRFKFNHSRNVFHGWFND